MKAVGGTHLRWHGWTIDDYREAFELGQQTPTCAGGVSDSLRRAAKRHVGHDGFGQPPPRPGATRMPPPGWRSLAHVRPEVLAELHSTANGSFKVAAIRYIGKESNKIEEAMSGLVTHLDEVLTEYRSPDHDPLWQLARDVIRSLPVKQTATGAGLSERTVKRVRAGHTVHKTARAKLADYAMNDARMKLREQSVRPPIDPEALLATCLATNAV